MLRPHIFVNLQSAWGYVPYEAKSMATLIGAEAVHNLTESETLCSDPDHTTCATHTESELVDFLEKQDEEFNLAMEPGDMVIFNGDKLWHSVTPLGEGEERVALTMEYVTNQEMGRFQRLYSNLKDAFGYFGIGALWKRPRPNGTKLL